MNIKEFIQQLRELDTYNVDVSSDGDLYTERDIDGAWIIAFSLECLIDEFENELEKNT